MTYFYSSISSKRQPQTPQITEETINRFIGMAEVVSKEIVKENINTTLDELQTKGLVNEVTTDNGNTGFVLNKNYKHE